MHQYENEGDTWNMFAPPPKPPPVDDWQFYHYEPDYKWFTRVLIECGYRPFMLVRGGNPTQYQVWAKTEFEVRKYIAQPSNQFWLEGDEDTTVFPQWMSKGMQVSPDAVIILDEADGGTINVGGKTIR